MSARVIAIVALAASLLLGLSPTAARAGTVFVSEGRMTFGDFLTQEDNRAAIVHVGDVYRVTDSMLIIGSGCIRVDEQSALCSAEGVASLSVGLGGGDDQLTVRASLPSEINGGPGADVIIAGDGSDQIFGGPGGDTVRAGGGDDQLLENDGEANLLDGGPGADGIIGGSGADEILGGSGDDRYLYGYYGDDLVEGGDGDDVLDGGAGRQGLANDADVLRGGDGADTVTYALHFGPIQVSLGNGPGDGALGERDDVAGDVERLIGSQAADELIGTSGNDSIDGAGGADVIDGGAGDDVLDGGEIDGAADTLRGGPGRDELSGRTGGDVLDGGAEADVLNGGGDADALDGGPGADVLKGADGDDRLDGGEGPDALSGGSGTDTVRYGDAAVEVTIDGIANDGAVAPTSEGRTRVAEGALSEGDNVDVTNESVDGSRVDDTVSGDGGANRLSGAAGEDYLDGRGGTDVLSGGGRSDTIMARDGRRDRVICGAGVDYVVADRADLVGRGARCEYVDDGTTTRPTAMRDVALNPRCSKGEDADVSPPGTRRSVPVGDRVRVPAGSRVDSLDCGVTLTAAVGGGRFRTGSLGEGTGTMAISQRRTGGGQVITRMRSTDCRGPARSAQDTAQASRYPRLRYRRRYGRFSIPVELRLDAALVRTRRGVATWEVDDRCGRSAEVRVTSGRLTVVDLGRDRRVVLGPGDRYVARAP